MWPPLTPASPAFYDNMTGVLNDPAHDKSRQELAAARKCLPLLNLYGEL